VQAVESCLVQLQDRARPEFKLFLVVFDERTDDFKRKVKLADAILRLPSRYLIGVCQEERSFGNAMPILGHSSLPLLCVQTGVDICHHLASDALVFNMGVTVGKAPALLTDLLRSHFDFSSALNEFLQVFGQ
jgi:hypothetical protein